MVPKCSSVKNFRGAHVGSESWDDAEDILQNEWIFTSSAYEGGGEELCFFSFCEAQEQRKIKTVIF